MRPSHDRSDVDGVGSLRGRLTKKKSHCLTLRLARVVKGFGVLAIGGLRVEKRVAMYLPALMCSGGWLSYTGEASRASVPFSYCILTVVAERLPACKGMEDQTELKDVIERIRGANGSKIKYRRPAGHERLVSMERSTLLSSPENRK